MYEGYGICFDEGGTFTKGNITNGKNVIMFGADMHLVFMQIIMLIIFTYYVIFLLKVLMVHQYMQKKFILKTLQNQVKNLY